MFEYKGYRGIFEYDEMVDAFVGHVPNINSAITFEARDLADLKREFEISVDVYLEVCAEEGIEPEQPRARER